MLFDHALGQQTKNRFTLDRCGSCRFANEGKSARPLWTPIRYDLQFGLDQLRLLSLVSLFSKWEKLLIWSVRVLESRWLPLTTTLHAPLENQDKRESKSHVRAASSTPLNSTCTHWLPSSNCRASCLYTSTMAPLASHSTTRTVVCLEWHEIRAARNKFILHDLSFLLIRFLG